MIHVRKSAAVTLTAAALLTVGSTLLSATNDPIAPSRLVQFGQAIAFSGDAVMVTEQAATGGMIHIYRRTPAGIWKESAKVTANGGKAGDNFGSAMAISGNFMLATYSADSTRGGVQIFKKNAAGAWTPDGNLGPEKPAAATRFGASIAYDGTWAFVSAPGEKPAPAVHMYHHAPDGAWHDVGPLTFAAGSEPLSTDQFGRSIVLNGTRLAVSAPFRDAKGAVYTWHLGSNGTWVSDGAPFTGRTLPANAQLGVSMAFAGNNLFVGAPSANSATGLVVMFEWNTKSNTWTEKSSFAPFEGGLNRFGNSVGMVGDELWVGAPSAMSSAGAIFRIRKDAKGNWGSMVRMGDDPNEGSTSFGQNLIISPTMVAVGMPSDAGGEGTAVLYGKGVDGSWSSKGRIFTINETYAATTGAEVKCTDGKTKQFECGNTSLYSFLPISAIGGKRGTHLSGMWGWTDPVTGHDIALIGRTDAAAFVDVTDPLHPRYLGDLPRTAGANASSWREIKTYKNFALIVSDGSGDHHGIQFFDLTRLRTVKTPQHFTEDSHYDLGSIHDIVVNEQSGFAYPVGANGGNFDNCGGGLHMVDIHDPLHPKFAGCFADKETGRSKTGYTHDAQCVNYHGPDTRFTGREICMAANETHVSVQDVTDKKNPKVLGRASYPAVGYAHQGWFSEDQRYWFFDDELDESGGLGKSAEGTRTLVWDMNKLDDPVVVKEYIGPTKAIDHNQYVKGNRLYQSNYTAGLRILDISDPVNIREVGYLDTYPTNNNTQFAGTWSNYPFFKNGSIGVVSIQEGFFLVKDRTTIVP